VFYPAGKAGGEWIHRKLQRRLRDECLNVEWFSSLEDARQKLAKFREQNRLGFGPISESH
jgi:hypothetical protein